MSVPGSTAERENNKTMADEDFSYLPPPRDAGFYREEGLKEKFYRKTKENPFVPLGRKCLAWFY